MNDLEILQRAYGREKDPRNKRTRVVGWQHYAVGASRADITRLLEGGMVEVVQKDRGFTTYRLTERGQGLVAVDIYEQEAARVPAATVLEALEMVEGWDDLKEAIAYAIESRDRIHYLLEGPPACGKSLVLEGVRAAVPSAYIAFGSRTSASGLSDALFEHHPTVLLLDEADKMHNDCYSVMLGLMESGEVLETKSRKTRGVKLNTTVIAACNSSAKMPREFLSRFALHAVFPPYTRDQFIDVCRGFLAREGCPPQLAGTIGQWVYDYGLGDVRKARAVWQLMKAPEVGEVQRVVNLMLRYSGNGHGQVKQKQAATPRLEGL